MNITRVIKQNLQNNGLLKNGKKLIEISKINTFNLFLTIRENFK